MIATMAQETSGCRTEQAFSTDSCGTGGRCSGKDNPGLGNFRPTEIEQKNRPVSPAPSRLAVILTGGACDTDLVLARGLLPAVCFAPSPADGTAPDTDVLVIAADSGFRKAGALGLTPRLLVGDFDSMPLEEALSALRGRNFIGKGTDDANTNSDFLSDREERGGETTPCLHASGAINSKTNAENPSHRGCSLPEIIRVPREKDETDTMLACRLAVERGCGSILVIGGFGGRCDHWLSNLFLLENLRGLGVSVRMTDGRAVISCLYNEEKRISRDVTYFSIFALDECTVTLRGCKYPLENAPLTRALPYAVSNEVTGDFATAAVSGCALLCEIFGEEGDPPCV